MPALRRGLLIAVQVLALGLTAGTILSALLILARRLF